MKERLWCSEVEMLYPRKWIVMVNCDWEPHSRLYGEIYLITDDKEEARRVGKELKLGGKMGRVSVFEGFNDTPQIGGLEIVCTQ